MWKIKMIFCLTLFILYACVFGADVAGAVVLDDVLEAVVENSFKKAGKNVDDLADLRKGSAAFSNVIKKNDDFLDALNTTRKIADDDLLNIRKIGFPTGSHYADDLMKLSKKQRFLAYALDDVTSRLAKLPQADDVVKAVGPKGLLLGAVYGDDTLNVIYRIAKEDDIWDMVRASKKALDDDLLKVLGKSEDFHKISPFIDTNAIRKVNNIEPVDMAETVMKKYGRNGQKSMTQFFEWVKNRPKTVALGLFVATVYAKPDIIMDAAGKLKKVILDELTDVTADAIITTSSVPIRLSRKIFEKLSWNLPFFLEEGLIYLFAFFIAMGILFLIPFTRFIPKNILSWIKYSFLWCLSIRKKIFKSRTPSETPQNQRMA
jgi:cytochrome c556